MQNKKTALVTGGAGFIGSHLCDYLLERDFRVICMDNLITGSLKNIEHIRSGDFDYINHNITVQQKSHGLPAGQPFCHANLVACADDSAAPFC
ncbi:MAG: GDP-mannose 4,6-dehydratase [Anaerolineales bacterium]